MIKAFIFDMDGVISDTQTLHLEVDKIVMRRYGITMKKEMEEKIKGITDKDMFCKLQKIYGVPRDIEKAIREKWEIMMEKARNENSIKPVPGAIDLINMLEQKKFKLALASCSPSIFVETVLSKLGIKEKFEQITTGEDVQKGKPEPEIFLLTAKKLNVVPESCLVIEDSVNGMKAAKKAGMRCIGLVRDEKEGKPSSFYPADFVIRDLGEIAKVMKNLTD